MAIKVDYVARETATNLRRNLVLTVASVLTVAVSLSLVGAALLLRDRVQSGTSRWKDGIEFVVFLKPDVTANQSEAVLRELQASPEVRDVVFVSQDEAYDEFRTMFSDTPEMVDSVSPEVLPPSYRVVPAIDDADAIESLGRRFEGRPGVFEVAFAKETAEQVLAVGRILQLGMIVIAVILLVAATSLIFNTIRTAIFARRREIEIMKLVGATNWFIRVPFMVEGMIQGLLGAAGAVAATYGIHQLLDGALAGSELFRQFSTNSGDVLVTAILVAGVGVVVGALGSGIAVTRFLDV